MENKVSLLVNCLNEVNNLKNNIIPLAHHFDEVVIVDMQSNDGSAELIKKLDNSRFIEIEKMGYVEPARKIGINSCKYDYVFILDADEILSEKIILEINRFRKGEKTEFIGLVDIKGLMIPRYNSMFSQDITWGKFAPENDKQLRFFKKGTVEISSKIHSGINFKCNMEVVTLPFSSGYYIYHFHSATALEFIGRVVRYAEYENTKQPGKNSFNVTNAIKAFVKEYILSGGYKHGKTGFALAYILSLREFLKGK
ncbi:glycosyltransferase family 2 protein [Escherichia coli]|uniref:glycosyltransferase family 2 protein n=2 Tax=Escherichia coli TaxID=562 RepID=UPI000A37D74A|nr:glycosyltransferase family 2 protein [Escherichia coli]EEQ8254400.1 glycosyltransferase family 2 protein [Escherichia coli]EER2719632.1 glycosyltransferase family 2 protein [Escherichia coli]EER7106694.1 glycosyltransferase family 2 protein [Escherichia coli]EER9089923.1 glycosyltransferase family 2 protein [Escherichia coli]EES3826834.1 glycosyltransferase family 2 protein [Escherichia coli]